MKKLLTKALALLAFSFVCVALSSCGGTSGGGGSSTLSIVGAKYKATIKAKEAGEPDTLQIIEFKEDATFVMTASVPLVPTLPEQDVMKGTYKVNGNKISTTVTWVLQDDPKKPILGKTFELDILDGGKKIKAGDMVFVRV
jgi:lipoprotein